MTKKDYVKIAKIVKQNKLHNGEEICQLLGIASLIEKPVNRREKNEV